MCKPTIAHFLWVFTDLDEKHRLEKAHSEGFGYPLKREDTQTKNDLFGFGEFLLVGLDITDHTVHNRLTAVDGETLPQFIGHCFQLFRIGSQLSGAIHYLIRVVAADSIAMG